MTPQDTLIPVILLTGFLGAGKTTVLNAWLHDPALKDTAVIINEFGEIGLDHDLVEEATEDMVLLKSGCLCCTVRGDLIETLRDLFLRRVRGEISDFARIVIETTGLADPAPVLHALLADPLVSARYRLESVVTVIDAVNGEETLNRHSEALKQAAVADRILVTKSDLASAAMRASLMARLKTINPTARFDWVEPGKASATWLLGSGLYNPASKTPDVLAWLNAEAAADQNGHDHHAHDDHRHHHHGHDINRHDDHIRAFCVTYDKPVPMAALEMWLNTLTAFKGPDLLRIKGIVNVAELDKPVVIHGVQHVLHPLLVLPRWPSDDRRTRIVCITRDIPKETLQETLAAFAAGA